MRQKLDISWDIPGNDSKLRRFKRYLKDNGVRPSTLENYIFRISKYFDFVAMRNLRLKWLRNTVIS